MKRIKLTLFGRECYFLSIVRKRRKHRAFGYTNRCKDGRYIIFLDYDNRKLSWIEDELRSMQKKFVLSTFYVFQSSKGHYHAVCLDKLSLKNFLYVLNWSSSDTGFKAVPYMFGMKLWSLRINNKNKDIPFLVSTVPNVSKRMKSSAHTRLLQKVFKVPNLKTDNGDGSTMIISHWWFV